MAGKALGAKEAGDPIYPSCKHTSGRLLWEQTTADP